MRRAPASPAMPIFAGNAATPSAALTARSSSPAVATKAATWTRFQPRTSPSRSARDPSLPVRPGWRSAAASGDWCGRAEASAMQPLSLGIDEVGRNDAGLHLLILQRESADDFLAYMLEPALEQAERDVLVQLDGPGNGGDIAAAMTLDLVAGGKQDRSAAQL